MPTNVADVINDRVIAFDASVLRLEAGERRIILRDLERLQRRLRANLDRHVPEDGIDTVTRRRTAALFSSVTRSIDSAYRRINNSQRARLENLAQFEVEQVSRAVNAAVQVPIISVGVSQDVLEAMLDDNIILGQPLAHWWNEQAARTASNFRAAIRQGLIAGETVPQLARRVRGSRANNFQDGIMAISRRGAETVTRTAIQSVRNEAREQTIRRNSNVIRGRQAVVTFDQRTSNVCISRSGFAWDLEGKPLNSRTTINYPGAPPWHPNCRSTVIPLTKSFADLVDDPDVSARVKASLDKLPPGTRASMNGYVAADTSYPEWLRMQSVEVRRRVLGRGRQRLFDNNELSLRDLVNESGRPLTLEQLQRLQD